MGGLTGFGVEAFMLFVPACPGGETFYDFKRRQENMKKYGDEGTPVWGKKSDLYKLKTKNLLFEKMLEGKEEVISEEENQAILDSIYKISGNYDDFEVLRQTWMAEKDKYL